MKLEDYTKSMNTFEVFYGAYLSEFISDLKQEYKVGINDDNSLFYAKGFHAKELTDELYYFNKETVKIVKLNKDEEGKLEGVTIINRKTSIVETELTLGKEYEIGLKIKFEDDTTLVLHSKNDSDGKAQKVAGKQIKNIYELLIN